MTNAGRERVDGPFSSARAVVSPPPLAATRSTPLLLQGQDHTYRAPDECLDFQERAHQLELDDDGDGSPVPCVLVLARAADMEMNELSFALAERGIRMVRIDADRCLDLALTIYTDAPLLEFDRWLLRPLLTWRRRFDLTALPIDPRTLTGAYAHDQWRSVAGWLSARPDWAHVNSPRTTNYLDRLTQLTDAATFGLSVPRTAVTTRPARSRPGGGSCLVKAAGHHLLEPLPGAMHGLFPRPLETSRAGDTPEPAPVIVQQYLPADAELRVFVVGDRLIAYRVDNLESALPGADPGTRSVSRTEVSSALADQLLALSRHWRLEVAAFSLLVVDGEPVFIEVDVNCDWRWFEHRSGAAEVSAAVHDWVAGRFAELLTVGAGR